MKMPDRQYVGFILIAVAILAAALVQWVGPGLVALCIDPASGRCYHWFRAGDDAETR